LLNYIIRRLLLTIPTLLGIILITFFIIKQAPGDPVTALQGENGQSQKVNEEAIKVFRAHHHLDESDPIQFLYWVKNALTLNFGESFVENRPVMDIIWERIPYTLLLNILSLALVMILSLPLGMISAVKRGSFLDKILSAVLFVLYSMPSFWVALLLIIWLGVKGIDFSWMFGAEAGEVVFKLPFIGFKSIGWESLSPIRKFGDICMHLVLPTLCMTYGSLAFYSRYVRVGMLEVLRQDYVQTARAKGAKESVVIWSHAFRNTLIPLLTLFGALLPGLLAGSVILEYIFAWPGIGRKFFEAILQRDYNLIMGLSTISAVLTLIGILLADILYAVADPRITYD
jgi:peptide/nickel transport system permease protein